ncbi:mannose-1-phosphate guanylyltransferase/mannose-6-phosphate isomerase [Vreelandella zhaodongensis]|uniref:mannose-1-phosphate guanylyltransferase/mannose-6-phosphate isomerase n=1 Tax=Vreelandella zhaodongensis TaxID=1176240 RepID=UPI003EBC72DD
MIIPVILSGGSGSRLWPVSREEYPKQFLNLHRDDQSLLQEAANRIKDLENAQPPLVICNETHRFLVAEQLHQIGIDDAQIILEPCGRNTAPAIALAAAAALEVNADAKLLVMPADHVIKDEAAFIRAVKQGQSLASDGKLITFGITPQRAHTGYGYIKRGAATGQGFEVLAFVEKPDATRAAEYLASGNYLWNSGIFLFKALDYLKALRQHAPAMLDACERAYALRSEDMDFTRIDGAAFAACPSDSIDYAIMEKASNVAVVPVNPGWSDIGAWDALHELKAVDDNNNATHGDVILHDTHSSLVHSESRLVAAVGVDNLIIVETGDAVLVVDRHKAQDTKKIVEALQAAGRTESKTHQQVYRPWGHYRTLALTDSFQVKEIVVKPGAKLSLQMHHHRAEHWVVVEGTAKVTQGKSHGDTESLKSFLLSEDESTYIPLGTVHRLENPGVIPLKLIEVQTGSYLGEDDIVRYSDDYGRE